MCRMAFCHMLTMGRCVCVVIIIKQAWSTLDSHLGEIHSPTEDVVERVVECVVSIEITILLHLYHRPYNLTMK